MDLIELRDLVLECIRYLISSLVDLFKLYPGNIDPFFSNVKPKSVGFLRLYLIIIGTPLLLGYYLYFNYQATVYSSEMSLKLSLVYYLVGISLPMVASYVLYLFDVRLVQRKVGYPEAFTLFAYAFSFALLSGILRFHSTTWILHLLAIAYSICLVYGALGARFGYEKIIQPFIFLMLSGGLVAIILFTVLVFLLQIPPEYHGFSMGLG